MASHIDVHKFDGKLKGKFLETFTYEEKNVIFDQYHPSEPSG